MSGSFVVGSSDAAASAASANAAAASAAPTTAARTGVPQAGKVEVRVGTCSDVGLSPPASEHRNGDAKAG